jgi:apolipoprotein N-acyltransferase
LRNVSIACTKASVILAFLAGAVSALGFAPLDCWPLTLLALALLIDRVQRAPRLPRAIQLGLIFGVGHFLIGLNWIATAFTYQANMPAWYGWGAVPLLSVYLALFPALCCGASWWVAGARRLAFTFIFAALWMLSEWLRATLLTGFAWDPIGAVWMGLPWVAQAAAWIGVYGLSGLAILIAGLFGIGLQWRSRTTLGVSILLAAVTILLGRSLVTGRAPENSGLRIQVVQPNIGQDKKYDPDLEEQHERTYVRLSGAPGPSPRIVMWPEGATLHYLELEPDARVALAEILGPQDLLLTGGPSAKPTADGAHYIYHNSVFALDPSGELRWRYDKAHLVPFGEYLPLRAILTRLGLSRLVPGEADFLSGEGPQTFELPGWDSQGRPASIGVQICYEIIFSGHIIDESHRPSFLFNPSNDAWFGAWGPAQHLAQAQLRAIEEGIPIVRATPNGISALIGPTGNVIQRVPRHTAGVINALVPTLLPPTVFSRYGLFASLIFGSALLIIGLILRTRKAGVIVSLRGMHAAALERDQACASQGRSQGCKHK